MILSTFILQAIIVLENSGALVDGIVCEDASTNRLVIASSGFNGYIKNKMQNPCDNRRSVFFFCDVPHLRKTIRNNLLKAKEFMTPGGTVKFEHYAVSLHRDLNPKTGLCAVPNLTEKHIPGTSQPLSENVKSGLLPSCSANQQLVVLSFISHVLTI